MKTPKHPTDQLWPMDWPTGRQKFRRIDKSQANVEATRKSQANLKPK